MVRVPFALAAAVPLTVIWVNVPCPVDSCMPTLKGCCLPRLPFATGAKAVKTSICLPRLLDCVKFNSCSHITGPGHLYVI